jgi:hypothetical protein
MAKDGLTYSNAIRAAAEEAAAALGTSHPIRARRQRGNDGTAHVLLELDAEKDRAPPRKGPDVQPADARTITTLEACIADLRSLLAKAEERAIDERSRCDRLMAETLAANARAAHLEGELTALRSRPVPWWQRWRQANGARATAVLAGLPPRKFRNADLVTGR